MQVHSKSASWKPKDGGLASRSPSLAEARVWSSPWRRSRQPRRAKARRILTITFGRPIARARALASAKCLGSRLQSMAASPAGHCARESFASMGDPRPWSIVNGGRGPDPSRGPPLAIQQHASKRHFRETYFEKVVNFSVLAFSASTCTNVSTSSSQQLVASEICRAKCRAPKQTVKSVRIERCACSSPRTVSRVARRVCVEARRPSGTLLTKRPPPAASGPMRPTLAADAPTLDRPTCPPRDEQRRHGVPST